jgi:hypothetical protein
MLTVVLNAPGFARFRRKISDNVLAVLQKRLRGLGLHNDLNVNFPVVLPHSTEIPTQGCHFHTYLVASGRRCRWRIDYYSISTSTVIPSSSFKTYRNSFDFLTHSFFYGFRTKFEAGPSRRRTPMFAVS